MRPDRRSQPLTQRRPPTGVVAVRGRRLSSAGLLGLMAIALSVRAMRRGPDRSRPRTAPPAQEPTRFLNTISLAGVSSDRVRQAWEHSAPAAQGACGASRTDLLGLRAALQAELPRRDGVATTRRVFRPST